MFLLSFFFNVLRYLGDFLPFWWFLIVFFLFHRHRDWNSVVLFTKLFSRTVIFMDIAASYLLSSTSVCTICFGFLSSLCLQSCSSMVTFPNVPKHYLNFTANSFKVFSYLWIIPLYTVSKEQSSPLLLPLISYCKTSCRITLSNNYS